MNTFIKSFRTLSVAASVAIALTSLAHAAPEASAEQRRACTPDAFRLCSSHIPNVDAIIACMRTNKSKLSPECKLVFDKPAPKTVASKGQSQTQAE
jgi:hypothetical protein